MSAPTVVRASSAAALLAAVPRLVGMRPSNSLVLAAFSGRRAGHALRVDLPAEGADLAAFADTVTGLLCRVEGADGVAPVVYTDAPFARARSGEAVDLLAAVRASAGRAGLRVHETLLQAADGWAVVHRDERPARRELAEIGEPPDVGHPLVDVQAAVTMPARSSGARAAFARSVEAQLLADGAGLRDRLAPDPAAALEAALERTRPASGAAFGAVDPALALLAAAIRLPRIRDVVLLQAGWGVAFGRHAWRRCVLETDELRPDEAVALAFSGGDMARPDPDRLERAIDTFRAVAALTDRAEQAPVLTVLAWLHWSLGRGSVAGPLTAKALQADPAHGLADLLAGLLAAGTLPEWAYRAEPLAPAGRAWLARPAGTLPLRTGERRSRA